MKIENKQETRKAELDLEKSISELETHELIARFDRIEERRLQEAIWSSLDDNDETPEEINKLIIP